MGKTAAQKAAAKIATKERVMIAGRDGIIIDYVDDPDHDASSKKPPKQVTATRFVDHYPFLMLYRRDTFTELQFKAGMAFEEDWYYGRLEVNIVKEMASVLVDYQGSATFEEADRMIFHKRRFNQAKDYVRSKKIIPILENMILYGMKTSDVAKIYLGPVAIKKNSAIIIDRMKTGLDLLDEFYKENKT